MNIYCDCILFPPKAILERTGYGLDVTTGQRKYGGPPPEWEGGQPGPGHEVSLTLFFY